MHPARIAELLQPFLLPAPDDCHSGRSRSQRDDEVEAYPERSRREPAVLSTCQLQYISTYIDLLLRWNSRVNLTAIRNQEEIVIRHFGESFFAAGHLFPHVAPEPRIRLADLGSGAGFPGIPIKLCAPDISLTLIESNHKKAAFLHEVARVLTLTDVNIHNVRAETLHQSSFDVITMRAVERLADVLPTAATLLVPSGRLALLISHSQRKLAQSILPHFIWQSPIRIPHSDSRILSVACAPQRITCLTSGVRNEITRQIS